VMLLSGDFTRVDVLSRANAQKASMAVLLADDTKERNDQARDALTVLAALTIEKLNPTIFTCAELLNRENEEHLRMAKVEEVVITSEVAGLLLGSAAQNRGIPNLVEGLMLSSRRGCRLATVDLPEELSGKTFLDALCHFSRGSQGTIVCLVREGRALFNPPHDMVLAGGDAIELLACDDVRASR